MIKGSCGIPRLSICVFADGDEESVSVTERDSVTLKSGFTELKTLDDIEWRFSGSRIATITRNYGEISVWVKADGSFRDRLQLDNQTGDLKISNISTTDSGEYKPLISSINGSPPEVTFTVKVNPVVVSAAEVKSVSVLVGDTVTLQTDLTEIQIGDEMQWRFEHQNTPIAEINRATEIFITSDGPDDRFRGRLKLDHRNGFLTITNITTQHTGLYQVEISSTISSYIIHHTQSFRVTVSGESINEIYLDSFSVNHLDENLFALN
ncbi:uncharacterized protein LOC113086832 [Carassius auratus]|uniref:Uncharacterized protein LOC113086832 n=1 Tax=Carassius auratus TaxID=7957 RepID=A0A6P6NRU8_CARAU|nr:uncharacterized protein LOC113086832 [Carassius auratus]